jgi:prepilin-type N-terminal cleavage/methylation domain-containing protein
MNNEHRTSNDERRSTRDGFSLTEVLMSIGILAIGMLFIAGVFPVGIHFTTVAAERTIAAAAADEAFAKIKLYGVNLGDPDLNNIALRPFELVMPLVPFGEYSYPSTPAADSYSKRYWWSAICRKTSPDLLSRDVQVTVFVSRKVGVSATRPVARYVSFNAVLPTYDLTLSLADRMLIGDGCTIVDNETGQMYRVLSRTDTATNGVIRLDQLWQGGSAGSVWVVPPPVGGGRNPCIAVYQKVIRF